MVDFPLPEGPTSAVICSCRDRNTDPMENLLILIAESDTQKLNSGVSGRDRLLL